MPGPRGECHGRARDLQGGSDAVSQAAWARRVGCESSRGAVSRVGPLASLQRLAKRDCVRRSDSHRSVVDLLEPVGCSSVLSQPIPFMATCLDARMSNGLISAPSRDAPDCAPTLGGHCTASLTPAASFPRSARIDGRRPAGSSGMSSSRGPRERPARSHMPRCPAQPREDCPLPTSAPHPLGGARAPGATDRGSVDRGGKSPA